MLVRFKVNLGSRDARTCSLDFRLCGAGMELDVSDKAGEWLVANGIAEAVPTVKAESKPAPLTGRVKSDKPTHKEI